MRPSVIPDDQKLARLDRAEHNFAFRFALLLGYLIGALTEHWVHGSAWMILAGVLIGALLTVVFAVVAIWREVR